MLPAHLWLWNKAKVIKSYMNQYTPSKIIILESLKDLYEQSVQEKANVKVFVKSGNIAVIFLEYMWRSEIVICSWSG